MKRSRFVLMALLFAAVADAQPSTSVMTRTATLQLRIAPMTIAPVSPIPPFHIIAGTHLQIVAPPGSGPARWFKNYLELPNTERTLDIPAASSDDAAVYYSITAEGVSEWISIAVARDSRRFMNLSTRVRIDTSHPDALTGLVIDPGPGRVLLLVRAVGPALAAFGIPDALAAPQLRVFNSTGAEVAPASYADFQLPSQFTLEEATRRTGAFALPAGGNDIARLYYVTGGAYVAQVSSATGGAGTVLLEVYDVPMY